jgi:hypothetical protein
VPLVRSAASSTADKIGIPELSINSFAIAALVPCKRTMIGTLIASYIFNASTTPCTTVTTNNSIKILIKIALRFDLLR